MFSDLLTRIGKGFPVARTGFTAESLPGESDHQTHDQGTVHGQQHGMVLGMAKGSGTVVEE